MWTTMREACPSCGAEVVVGQLNRGGFVVFASFEVAECASMYLRLPSAPTALAPGFVPSATFGAHALHFCALTMLPVADAYHPRPAELPS